MVDAALNGKTGRGQRHQDLQQRRQGRAVLPAQAGRGRQGQLGEGSGRLRLLQELAIRLSETLPAGAPGACRFRGTDEMTAMLEMRGISKSFPGVRALRDVNFTVEAGRDPCPRRRERRRQVDADEGAERRLSRGPATTGTIVFDGEERRFRDINDTEALGIIIIHQELALIPLMSIAENIFLSHPPSRLGVIDREEVYRRTRELLAQVGLQRVARHADHRSRRRQAAAGRDRQGAVQEGEAAHPRRADRQPERGRQRRAARPADCVPGAGHRLDPDLAQAQRGRQGRRPHHRAARRPHGRFDRLPDRVGRGGPYHPQHGRPRPRAPFSRAPGRRSASPCWSWRTGRCSTRCIPTGR